MSHNWCARTGWLSDRVRQRRGELPARLDSELDVHLAEVAIRRPGVAMNTSAVTLGFPAASLTTAPSWRLSGALRTPMAIAAVASVG